MATHVGKSPPITVEQYQTFEGHPGLRDELILGEIVLSPQPKPLHQEIAKRLERLLDDALASSGYVAQRDTNIKLQDWNSMPAPDVFVVGEREWRAACRADRYLESAPVLAVEIISPANRRSRVLQKVDLYLAAGVAEVWTVSPKLRVVRAYRLREGVRQTEQWQNDGTISLPVPLRGTIGVSDILPSPDPAA